MPATPARSRFRLVPILLAQGLGIACGVAGVKLNSHFIAPDALGTYGVFLTFTPIGMWVVHAGLLRLVARHWATSGQRGAMLREVLHSWARRLPLLALAVVAGAVPLASLTPTHGAMLWLALFLAATLLAFAAIAQTALQAERAHWTDCAVSVSSAISRTFFPPLLFVACSGALAALWFGFCLHALVAALAGAWALRKYWRCEGPADPPTSDRAIYQGPLFMVLALAGWTLAGLNRWIVVWFFGDVAAGYFTLAGGAAIVVTSTLGTTFMQYHQPGFFALGDGPPDARSKLARQVDRVALIFGLLALVAVGVFSWVAPVLVGPLINPRYRDALGWILPSGAFGITTITAVFYHSMLLAGKRERACGPTDLTTAAVLTAGGITAATGGAEWFARWLIVTPLVTWLVTRSLARYYFFKPAAT